MHHDASCLCIRVYLIVFVYLCCGCSFQLHMLHIKSIKSWYKHPSDFSFIPLRLCRICHINQLCAESSKLLLWQHLQCFSFCSFLFFLVLRITFFNKYGINMNKMSGKSGLCQDVRCFFQIQRLDNRTLGQQVLDHLKSWCDSCLERQCLISAKSHKLPKTWKLQAKSKSNNHSRKIHEVSAPRSLNHPIIPQYPSNPCPPVTVTRCSTAMLYYALLPYC